MPKNNTLKKRAQEQTPILIFTAAICILPFLLLGKNDAMLFFEWWIYMLLIGVISIPVSRLVLGNCYPFAKIVGIFIPGSIMMTLGLLFGLPFNRTISIIIILAYAAVNAVLAKKRPIKIDLRRDIKYELIFFFMFLFWTYLIGFNPSTYGTEKFMDYGFLQKMLISSKLPPEDIWYAGENINYYYGGQFFAAFIAKTMLPVKTSAEYAYNMMRALIPALMFTGVFGLAEQIIEDKTKNKKTSNIFAALSAAAVCFAGNGHYIIYGLIKPFLGISDDSYWFPDSTRYIGFNPDVPTDHTIHEFPCYSFVLGDLHAHMINIIFVILLIGILYNFLKFKKEDLTVRDALRYPHLYFAGIIWGIMSSTNYWDFIIYIVVIGITVIVANILTQKSAKKVLKNTAIQIGITAVTGILVSIPFSMHFQSVFDGVGIAKNHTALYQLLVLWGFPFAVSIVFLICFFKSIHPLKERLRSIQASNAFIFILSCCAMGLVLIPEFVYVRDIYEETNARANTMFKLTYQAFIMFGVCVGYIAAVLWNSQKKWKKIAAYVIVGIQVLMLGYFFTASNAWFPGWTNPSGRIGTYALTYLDETDFIEEKEAILWLKEKAENGEITGTIAEAPGDSYTAYERVSVVTGLSTPAGWKVHEWLWRGGYEGINERSNDIDLLYTGSEEEAKKIIEKYDIEYIFFGQREKEKYGEERETEITKLGEIVYNGGAVIVKVG